MRDLINGRLVLVAIVVSVAIVIGSYFGSHWVYRVNDQLLAPPPTLSNFPTTPIDSYPTVPETHPESGPKVVTSDVETPSDATGVGEVFLTDKTKANTEGEQAIQETLVQLKVEKEEVTEKLSQIAALRSEYFRESSVMETQLVFGKDSIRAQLEQEIERLEKILEGKLGPNPTLEECQVVDEWHQIGELMTRQNKVWEERESKIVFYNQKFDELEQREAELFRELEAITRRIRDLESRLSVK